LADEAEAVAQLSGADAADLDWAQASPAELEATIGRLEALIAGVPADTVFAGPSQEAFERVTSRIARLSTLAGPGITVAALTAAQLLIARRIGSSAGGFIRQEFGRRGAALGRDVRRLATSGIARGMSRSAIRQNVLGAFGQRLRSRDDWYFRIVSSTAASRARSFGQMVGYRQSGTDFYIWVALNDERTCEICRFLHGQMFPVASPLQAFNRVMASPDPDAAMVDAFPWYRVVGGERIEGGLRRGGDIHVQQRGAPLGVQVATVRESGVGQRDVTGTHTVRVNPRAAGGTLVPPAHGGCRCTTEAVT
jgi:SPP1 gp7 family putative phage head morphogenesis protein